MAAVDSAGGPRAVGKPGSGSRARQVAMHRLRDACTLLGVLATAPVSKHSVCPLDGEALRSLPGDELVPDAKICWTHAITIRACPTDIWPWLVQMGCRRAGWYSYDGLDNGGARSEERIVLELQELQVGDIMPMTPMAQDRFVVRLIEPERLLVLGDAAGSMSWAFVLEPIDATSTRLFTRSRGAIDSLALGLMLKLFWHPLDFGMQRRQLLNLKRLVEAGVVAGDAHRGASRVHHDSPLSTGCQTACRSVASIRVAHIASRRAHRRGVGGGRQETLE